MHGGYLELAGVLVVATLFGLLVKVVRQPALVGFILAGLLLGPLGLRMIQHHELYETLRVLGSSLLLFMVGLELDLTRVRKSFKNALLINTVQIAGSVLVAYILGRILNLPAGSVIFLIATLSFASSIVVVNILSESRDLNSEHGRISVATLILQDILAVTFLVLLQGFANDNAGTPLGTLIPLVIKLLSLIAISWLAAQHILPWVFSHLAKQSDKLFLGLLAWCFTFALGVHYMGISIEIGTFLAGVTLAPLPYALEITNRTRSLRDFFAILLFVSLGAELTAPGIEYFVPILIIVGFIVFIRPLLAFFTLIVMRQKARVSFLTALTQSNLSEFSIFVMALGVNTGWVSNELKAALVAATITTFLISAALIGERAKFFQSMRSFLQRFERTHRHGHIPEDMKDGLKGHIVILGYHRMGYHILKKLRALNHQLLVVDFNPDIIHKLRAHDISAVYGDIQDEELLETIKISSAYVVISTIPHREETEFLIRYVRGMRKRPHLIVTAHNVDDALAYYKLGVNYVILPHMLGGEHVGELIEHFAANDLDAFMNARALEMKQLRAKPSGLYPD